MFDNLKREVKMHKHCTVKCQVQRKIKNVGKYFKTEVFRHYRECNARESNFNESRIKRSQVFIHYTIK